MSKQYSWCPAVVALAFVFGAAACDDDPDTTILDKGVLEDTAVDDMVSNLETSPDSGVDSAQGDGPVADTSKPDMSAPDMPAHDMAKSDAAMSDTATPDTAAPDTATSDLPPGGCNSNADCPSPSEYCDLQLGCKTPGTCKPRPKVCTFILDPACGCDGKTYNNPCLANSAGVSINYKPACAATDFGTPDTMVAADTMPGDMGTPNLPLENVLYVTGATKYGQSVSTIKTDGTGKAAAAGLPASFGLNTMYVVGRREYAYVNRNQPMPLAHVFSYYQPVYLPGNQGYIYYYQTVTPAGYGFFLVKPDGTTKVLAFEAVSSTSTGYSGYVGMNEAGTLMAAAKAYNSFTSAAVHLIRTDGTTFTSSGTSVCDVTPASPAVGYIRYNSFTFANGGKTLFFVAATSSSQHYLFSVPVDCSAKATPVIFPTAVTTIDQYIAPSHDGSTIAVVAGSSTTSEDIIVVDAASGVATNVSASPADYRSPGYYRMYFSTSAGTMVDLSTKGTNVAYVSYASSNYELWVRPVNKSAAATNITAAANFDSTHDTVTGVTWMNDDDLVFWAGTSTSYTDMFHFKMSTGALTNLTKTGGTTMPYSGSPSLRPSGGWISPNGKYFYFVQYKYVSPNVTANIRAIDRATLAVTDITKNMYVSYFSSNIEAAAKGSRVFFFAETTSATNDENLYYFDQDMASAPVKVTSFTSPSYFMDIMPSDDGTLVAFSHGSASSSNARSMYVAQIGATTTVTKLSTTTAYVMDMKMFTSDDKAVVYGVGTSSAQPDVRAQLVTGGPVQILEKTPGYASVLMVWK